MTDQGQKRKITIKFNRREDGGLRAHSDDIPEFYIAGADPKTVLEDVVPVMETILRENYNEQLKIYAPSDFSAIAAELGLDDATPAAKAMRREALATASADYFGVKSAA